jgi:hypothetical protein
MLNSIALNLMAQAQIAATELQSSSTPHLMQKPQHLTQKAFSALRLSTRCNFQHKAQAPIFSKAEVLTYEWSGGYIDKAVKGSQAKARRAEANRT